MLNDLRYALRMLLRTPTFTAASILTLALGIGANTAIFSVVNAVLIRPLPFKDPSRLVTVFEKNDKLNLPQFSSSLLNYLSWKEQQQSFDQLAAVGLRSFNLTGAGDPEQSTALRCRLPCCRCWEFSRSPDADFVMTKTSPRHRRS